MKRMSFVAAILAVCALCFASPSPKGAAPEAWQLAGSDKLAFAMASHEISRIPITSIQGGTQGRIPYDDGTKGAWLGTGTSGYVLETLGASTNPAWASVVSLIAAQSLAVSALATGPVGSVVTGNGPTSNAGWAPISNSLSAGQAITITQPSSSPATIAASSAGASSLGVVELNTDLGGSATAPQVVGIRGVSFPSLATGYPYYNGSAWVFNSGSASAGGSNTDVQFNSSGAFGGDAGHTYGGQGGSVLDTWTPTSTSATVLKIAAPASFTGNYLNFLDSSGNPEVVMQSQSGGTTALDLAGATGGAVANSSFKALWNTSGSDYPTAGTGVGTFLAGGVNAGTVTPSGRVLFAASELWTPAHQGTNIAFQVTPPGSATTQTSGYISAPTTYTGSALTESYPQDVFLNTSSSTAVEFPSAASFPGCRIRLKWVVQHTPATICTVTAASGNVEGSASFNFNQGTSTYPGEEWESDGTNWWVIASH